MKLIKGELPTTSYDCINVTCHFILIFFVINDAQQYQIVDTYIMIVF